VIILIMPGYSDSALQGKAVTLSKVNRPEVIGRWIAGGRKSTPMIGDLATFITQWKKWWVSLQPGSRVQQGRKLHRAVDDHEDWEEL
jgi:hypothetical protein